jgi:hypothetical protein
LILQMETPSRETGETPSPEPLIEATSYTTWHQTAGYFDGDGGVILKLEMFTVSIGLDWADSYKPQLEAIRGFLIREGLRPARTYSAGEGNPVWHLRLTNQTDLIWALSKMAPLVVKKGDQVDASIRYLKDEITGEELIEAFNNAVRAGTRSGYLRTLKMPYTHSQGVAKGRKNLGKGPIAQRKISATVLDRVRRRREDGLTLREISGSVGVSYSSIQRALTRSQSGSKLRCEENSQSAGQT